MCINIMYKCGNIETKLCGKKNCKDEYLKANETMSEAELKGFNNMLKGKGIK